MRGRRALHRCRSADQHVVAVFPESRAQHPLLQPRQQPGREPVVLVPHPRGARGRQGPLLVPDPLEHDRRVGPGETGEVITRSDLVMNGYWNQPDKTEEAFKDGWLHTGDIGYMDEDGYLYLVDRKHDKIITGGLNVFPREVEEVLLTHPLIVDAAVVGVAEDVWGEAVRAFVVMQEGAKLSDTDVVQHCKQNLASYKKPKYVSFVDDIPRNPSGKILRQSCAKCRFNSYFLHFA